MLYHTVGRQISVFLDLSRSIPNSAGGKPVFLVRYRTWFWCVIRNRNIWSRSVHFLRSDYSVRWSVQFLLSTGRTGATSNHDKEALGASDWLLITWIVSGVWRANCLRIRVFGEEVFPGSHSIMSWLVFPGSHSLMRWRGMVRGEAYGEGER
jgi:hypothetical protein